MTEDNTPTMTVRVLGSGCAKCKSLHETVEQIVKKSDHHIEVEYSTDVSRIVEFGAMSSPALAINNELISSGKVPKEAEIEKAITDRINA